ncbi:uncharacterized protein F5Z01DRAFT_674103 [Emericellopsis atlantica]|uniref:Uncharacterized protein n=1 Tax=Emericellopsis atlantica TaxID=2614577 RepID=A0A9P7ZMC5_9HYPO|nr:uncharacterized protein F5Z01DRAFT_674103 [Emericellopsis atlantica]KAG9254357.1 hypothetical protein F5Z01DRAFT_674103 [Emericellopsis atlantica]
MASDDETVHPFDSISNVGSRTPRRPPPRRDSQPNGPSQAGYQTITITNSRFQSVNSENATPSIPPSPNPQQDMIAIRAPGKDFTTHEIPRAALANALPGVMSHIRDDNTLWVVDALNLEVLTHREDHTRKANFYTACRQILDFVMDRGTHGTTDNQLCAEMRKHMARDGAHESKLADCVGMYQMQALLLTSRAGLYASP